MATIFLSHSSKDKEIVKKIATRLLEYEHQPWLDEWEIRVGDSIVAKIEQGLKNANYVVVVLSTDAVESKWVDREWKAKYWEEVQNDKIGILPALIETCKIPTLLSGVKYANFVDNFENGLLELLTAIDPSREMRQDAFGSNSDFIKDVSGVLRLAHSQKSLSSILVDVMEFARVHNLKDIYNFCRLEIHGYCDEHEPPNDAVKKRPYRVIKYYASKVGLLNPSFVGFQKTSDLFTMLENDDKKFVPMQFIESGGVASIEATAANQTPDSIALTLRKSLGKINPDATEPDRMICLYAKPDSYKLILDSIRQELVKRIAALLPVM